VLKLEVDSVRGMNRMASGQIMIAIALDGNVCGLLGIMTAQDGNDQTASEQWEYS
jgi:hypothetical protein